MQIMSGVPTRKILLLGLCFARLIMYLLSADHAWAAEDASRDEHILVGDTILAGDLSKLKKLIEQDPERLNRLYVGRGILYYPASYRNPEILEYLLEKGADFRPQDGRSPLMDSVDGPNRSSAKCVEILLKYGAPVDNGFVSGKDRATPYMIALRRGDLEIAKRLLKHGADGAYITRHNDNVLTHLLRDRKNSDALLEAVKLAVENRADVNFEVMKKMRGAGTPLLFAAKLSNKEVYDFLVSAGANPNYKDYFGHTPKEYLLGTVK